MNKILNKYRELTKTHSEICFKTEVINNKFNLCIVSNNGPISITLDSSLYNEFNVYIDYNNYNFIEATTELLNQNFNNINYFNIKDGTLLKYYGNVEILNIPSNVTSINENSISNNSHLKYINGNMVESMQRYSLNNLKNVERIDFINIKVLDRYKLLPSLKAINVSDKLTSLLSDDNFREDLKINVISNNRIFEYSYDNSIDSLFFKETDAERLNDKELPTIRIDKYKRSFKATDDMSRFLIASSISQITSLIENLPMYIKDLVFSNNLRTYVISGYKDDGGYITDKNIMVVDTNKLVHSFYHELGHALDYNVGKTSSSNEFINLYESEKNNLYSLLDNKRRRIILPDELLNHYLSNKEEYFAECFKRYICNEKDFVNECPNTYNYINNLMINLEQNYNNTHNNRMVL